MTTLEVSLPRVEPVATRIPHLDVSSLRTIKSDHFCATHVTKGFAYTAPPNAAAPERAASKTGRSSLLKPLSMLPLTTGIYVSATSKKGELALNLPPAYLTMGLAA
jgi:hypothetical protein